nr:F-box protein At3g58530 isoform X3 [Populus alba]
MDAKEIEPKQTATTTWNRETIPKVMKIVSTKLPQRDLVSLLLVSPWLYRTLTCFPPLWMALDFREMNKAGDRLIAATSLCFVSLQKLESLNLNGCQKISDKGIEAIASTCSKLKVFSIYWNVRVTDIGIKHVVENCKQIVDLNFSGCKNISDKALQLIAENYQELESLNLTRCIKLTDGGLQQILSKCSSLQSLNLYALSSFTDKAYKKISSLPLLKFLDLCGAQNLSDEGLSCIAKCKNIVSLNLTWCVRVTDVGVVAIAEGCTSLEFLSLFGIVGVTDKCLEVLSRFCSNTVTTLDVNGCIGIKRRSRDELLQLFPRLRCFKVHS